MVHRDLKPDNVFLTQSGRRFLISGSPNRRTALPPSSGMLGTAGYLAPEPRNSAGNAVELGRSGSSFSTRMDLVCEMSTGQRAFARKRTIDTLHAILHDNPPNLWQAAGVPPDLRGIVMRLLERHLLRIFNRPPTWSGHSSRHSDTRRRHPCHSRRLDC